MKKIVTAIILVITVASSVFIKVNAEEELVNNIILGQANLNLSYDGTKMLDNVVDACLNTDIINVEGNMLTLKGSVAYNDESIPINLSCMLLKSKLYVDTFVGNKMIDKEGNFDVIHISLAKECDAKKLYVDNSLSNNDAIQIYLMKKDTREFIMLEGSIEKLLSKDFFTMSKSYIEEMTKDDTLDEHWWIKVFKPTNITNSPRSSKSNTDYASSTIFNGGIVQYKYYIRVKGVATIEDMVSGKGEDESSIEIIENRYWCDGVEYDDSFLQIFNCVATTSLYRDNSLATKDYLSLADWGQWCTKSVGGLSISPGLWIGGIPGIGVTWSQISTSVVPDGAYDIDDTQKIKKFKMTFPNALTAVGDKNTLVLKKREGSTTYSNRKSGFIYRFDIGFDKSYAEDSGTIYLQESYN
jgi:hypothetical protein